MQLKRFRVIDFRSVVDSDWIDVDDVTALVGENESGKTNILLPLWKLNPASEDGAIDLVDDYPRDRYHEVRGCPADQLPVFIQADFEPAPDLRASLAEMTGAPGEELNVARVERKYNGDYAVSFPNAKGADKIAGAELGAILDRGREAIVAADTPKPIYEAARAALAAAIEDVARRLRAVEYLSVEQLAAAHKAIEDVSTAKLARSSELVARQTQAVGYVDELIERATQQHPNQYADARKLVQDALPKFVYYSSYGNLNSEIYLPHVIDNMQRLARHEKLGLTETAKARTLKVLFEFVKLTPQDILQLGKPAAHNPNQAPTQAQIDQAAERTREREILLTAASTDLTAKFREWWRQGTHKFRFQADGDHFRIWVSDEKRPEEVELEARSSGLQWFFSFFLVFLVERSDEHKDAILLLDEPGMSLHPLAQRDLTKFFENLSSENQIIYTSHSPFLLDYDRLDQVKVVYIKDDGETAISANLRASERDPSRTKSIYAVFAALGLSTSETLLIAAAPIIVEGTVDQWYLSLAKTHLIHLGLIQPAREIVFLPAGGAKGVATVAAILAVSDVLPPVLLDSDQPGNKAVAALRSNLYRAASDRILEVATFTGMAGSEVEDLMPTPVLAHVATRLFPVQAEDFSAVYDSRQPIVGQIEVFAAKHGLALPEDWKIQLAKAAVQRMRNHPEQIDNATVERWRALFSILVEQTNARAEILG
jgi:energy-coupling factor transporter ATP-binding protein EcfA2